MIRLVFNQIAPGTWHAATPFQTDYYIFQNGSQWTWSHVHVGVPESVLAHPAHDFAHAADCCRADFEERTEACLGAPNALRRASDTIRRAERIARSDPKQSQVFEDLLQLARVACNRDDALEEAAKVAADRARDWLVGQPMETRRDAPPDIAAAIRALKGAEP